ncbi:Nuclease-related domain-containing protein [Butyrivibrio sp. ob235]|uniref:nuclease-related domain-containing protein n=1 Tax=Butyrivibrio sp. ob235 TaxID=1761780 RepID=UPI0008BADB01|nr:nuclease-related domain-containing protein [Butyrivibrio sp. ob235]SEM22630.1 Nuclease-related domain-containing protein [Butyrivibrio sp. ob235]
MNTNRVETIVSNMKSFEKDSYYRNELLQELFNLQQEVVGLTFNEDHADLGNLKLWDVERHLEQMNSDLDHVADLELERFENGCKVICSEIKAIISGNRGEFKAFKCLEGIEEDCIILKNVELTRGEEKTELDAVVVTTKGLYVVEVKNTSKDIFIDEGGNYFRTGEFLKWDSNIGGKMSLRERMLRELLIEAGINPPCIKSIVVFTNDHIEVRNKCKEFTTCFLSQLPYVISDSTCQDSLDEDAMNNIANAVESERCMEKYPFDFDVAQFKVDFAILMDRLEGETSEEDILIEDEKIGSDSAKDTKEPIEPTEIRWKGYVLTALGTAAATLLTVVAASSFLKGGKY